MRSAESRLAAAGVAQPRLDAQLLMAHGLGCDRATVVLRAREPLQAEQGAAFDALVARRLTREPLSHILGRREFWSRDFKVTADTLAPRADSETVIEAVLGHIRNRQLRPQRILDLGTGTGCLLLALLTELPDAFGIGIDRSEQAVRVARENARHLGLERRSAFAVSDWASALAAGFDVILSNPPYIPSATIDGLDPEVALYEPRAALDGGPDGLDAYRHLLPVMARLLAPNGVIALEIGGDQGNSVNALAAQAGFSYIQCEKDLESRDRCILAGFQGGQPDLPR